MTIEGIEVKNQSVTVGFTSDAEAGQWLEVDDVELCRSGASVEAAEKRGGFQAVLDPIWQAIPDKPMRFEDGRFAFFGRDVGQGEAISVAFRMRPAKCVEQVVMERVPRTGKSGWGVRLTAKGDVVFRIGSKESFADVVASGAYRAGVETEIACVFDRGEARVYVDGKIGGSAKGIVQKTDDATAAGSVGVHRTSPHEPYVGELQDIRVFNRALQAGELTR